MPRWTTTFRLASDAEASLRALGLDRFRPLMFGQRGEPIKRKPGLEVYRLDAPDGSRFYLKRSLPRPARKVLRDVLRALRRRRLAHTEALLVALAADRLADIGIPTMAIAAFGEQRLLGFWPRRGFVVARAVEGTDATEVFRSAPAPKRRRLLRALGRIMARLHAHGVYVGLRLHDLIIPPDAAQLDADLRPVMIDLDFKGDRLAPGPYDPARAVRNLAHNALMLLRGGDRLSPPDLRAFMQGYTAGLAEHSVPRPKNLVRLARARLRSLLAQHHADPDMRRRFPNAPTSA